MTTILDLPQELLAVLFQLLDSRQSRGALYRAHPCMRCSQVMNARFQTAHLSVGSGGAAVRELASGWPKLAPNPRNLSLLSGNYTLSPYWRKTFPDAIISFLRKSQNSARAAQLLTGVVELKLNGWRLGQQDATTVSLMLASTCPRLSSLILSSCQLSMALLRAQALSSRLTSLTIKTCSTVDLRSTEDHLYGGDALVKGIAAHLPCLQHLSLLFSDRRSLDFGEDILPDLNIAPLSSLESLRTLNVGAFDRYAAKDRMRRPGILRGLAQVLSGCTQLTRLALGMASVQLQIELPSATPATHPVSPSLLELELPGVSLQYLVQLLDLAPHLHTLRLGRIELPDELPELCASWLQEVLQQMQVRGWGLFQSSCPYVHQVQPPTFSPGHHLWLSYYPICGRLARAAQLLSALAPFHSSLHHLGLHRITLLPQDVPVLLSDLPGLESLILVRCDVRGVLAALVPQLLQLRVFHLRLGVVEQADFVNALLAADEARHARAGAVSSSVPDPSYLLRVEVSSCCHHWPTGLDAENLLKPEGLLHSLAYLKLHDIEKDSDVQNMRFFFDSDSFEQGDWDYNGWFWRVDELAPGDTSDEDAEDEKAAELQGLLDKSILQGGTDDEHSDDPIGSWGWDYSGSEGDHGDV